MKLAGQLARIKGNFILSINDTPAIRNIFAAFKLEAVSLTYSIASGAATEARELIITPSSMVVRAPAPGLFDRLEH